MTTKKFEATPTPNESFNLESITQKSVDDAWKDYETKPEYKKFNKHDLIESLQEQKEDNQDL